MLKFQPNVSTSRRVHTVPADEFLTSSADTLKLLSFNIQVGIETQAYHQYFTKSWQHLWPQMHRNLALKRIAQIMSHFDLVGIQEADGGSFRSGFVNQVEFLAKQAGFNHWYQQINRNLGPMAKHSNGALTQIQPQAVKLHSLPGLLPGRGAMLLDFGELAVVIMHLALSRSAQRRQLGFVRELIQAYPQVVLMGDMNTQADYLLDQSPLVHLGLQPITEELPTFPSWHPKRALDHILVSENVMVKRVAVLDVAVSDHLPIAMEIQLPAHMSKVHK
ncbi:endonuclease/exonuclease/phosphatase family protein [Bermanella sp. R86510]|uniref:endonuclease/exonuclease/phosphatase family protein n=1 Tax=unclassified Bermanella TaxID=2627862 RepID=UPI0037C81006